MTGAKRVGYFGVDFGKQLYYLQSPAYLFLLCVGAAFCLERPGVPYVTHQEVSVQPRALAHPRQRGEHVRIVWVSACVVAVGLYAIAFVTSATTMNDKDFSNEESATSADLFHDIARAARRRGQARRTAAVLDTAVPEGIVASADAPWNDLLYALPVVRPSAAINQLRTATFSVAPDRDASPCDLPAVFRHVPWTTHRLRQGGLRWHIYRSPGTARSCITSVRPGRTIDVQLGSAVNTAAAWLLVGLKSSSGGLVNVSTVSNGSGGLVGTVNLSPASKPLDYLLPLTHVASTTSCSRVRPVGRVCVSHRST